MEFSRRDFLTTGGVALAGGSALWASMAPLAAQQLLKDSVIVSADGTISYVPVITPQVPRLPWLWQGGVKVFHLTAEPIHRETLEGVSIMYWGYNGQTPGPTIEAVEGDRVRLLVTNHLPEPHGIHWHGILLPNGMDGVSGLTQPPILPGETVAYEFTLHQHGTQMYCAGDQEQVSAGLLGFFIIHPKQPPTKVHRDFALFFGERVIPLGKPTETKAYPKVSTVVTLNGSSFPEIEALVARVGDRVRIRLGNLTGQHQSLHLHGYRFMVTGTDGGAIPPSAQYPQTTVDVPAGTTRDIEFVATHVGDWAVHGYTPLSGTGYEPTTKLALGPYGAIHQSGAFTVLKVRENLTSYTDPGWFKAPEESLPKKVDTKAGG